MPAIDGVSYVRNDDPNKILAGISTPAKIKHNAHCESAFQLSSLPLLHVFKYRSIIARKPLIHLNSMASSVNMPTKEWTSQADLDVNQPTLFSGAFSSVRRLTPQVFGYHEAAVALLTD